MIHAKKWNISISEAMTVITARPRWLRKSVGTFTAIHTTWVLVSSKVLQMALLWEDVEKITLDFTIHTTHYTDAARGKVLQRRGGLENRDHRPSWNTHADFLIEIHRSSCTFFLSRKHKIICESLSSLQKSNTPPTQIPHKRKWS